MPHGWHRHAITVARSCHNDGTGVTIAMAQSANEQAHYNITGEIADSSAETVRPAQKKRGKPRHTSLGIKRKSGRTHNGPI